MRLLKYITELPEGRKQAFTFLLFVLFSAGIWTVNALNQRHTVKTRISVRSDGRYAGAKNLPAEIEIELKGRGFDLIPVLSSASSFSLVQPESDSVWNIRPSVSAWLAKQGKNIELTSVHPASILSDNTGKYTKRLPVISSLSIRSGGGWVQSGPEGIWPDSITLFSDRPIPDSLKRLSTVAGELRVADGSCFGSHPIVLPPGTETLESSRVWIYVPAERATEARVKVQIHSLRPGYLTIPGSAEMQCRVPIGRYSATTADRFIVVAESDPSDPERAILKILHAPYWCSNLIVQPASVRMFRTTTPAS